MITLKKDFLAIIIFSVLAPLPFLLLSASCSAFSLHMVQKCGNVFACLFVCLKLNTNKLNACWMMRLRMGNGISTCFFAFLEVEHDRSSLNSFSFSDNLYCDKSSDYCSIMCLS